MRTLTADPEEQLTGREIRRLTARAAAARSGRGAVEVFSSVAYAVVCVAVTVGLVVGIADAVRGVVTLSPDAQAPDVVLSLDAVRAMLWTVVGALSVSLAARLGPVGVSDAGVRWWVPTGVDRSGLLVGSWWSTLATWTVGTSVAATTVAGVTGVPVTAAALGGVALVGAEAGALFVAAVGVLQARGIARAARRAADGLVALVPVLGVLWIIVGSGPWSGSDDGGVAGPAPTSGLWLVAVVLAAAALVVVLVWRRSLGRLSASVLAERAGTAQHAGAATLSLDTRELARALGRGRAGRARRPSRRLRVVRGPRTALLVAEALALTRTPGLLLAVPALACSAVVAQQVPALRDGAGLVVVTAVVGLRAAQTGARGASEADVSPALDAMLPLGSRTTRMLRTVFPALVSGVVLLAALAPTVVEAGAPLGPWVLLLLLAGAGFGAAAVRGAYRRPPDWSAPLLATPAGALPTGAVSSALRGPDLALVVVVPLAVAVVVGAASWVLVVAQAVVAVGAVVVASWVPAPDHG